MKTIACLLSITLLSIGCSHSHVPSKKSVYKQACRVVKEAEGVPSNAKLASMKDAAIGIGKNAASVDVPYTYTDVDGETKAGSHTVWLKRVARTWVATRVEPTSNYR